MLSCFYRSRLAFIHHERLKLLILLGLMISTAVVYSFNLHSSSRYYEWLGKAFLSGYTNISPTFVWDISLYKGKYYLYFGPVPALLLWIPVKLATGIGIGDATITLVMMTAGTWCLFLLIYLITLRQPLSNAFGLSICLLAIGFSKWMVPELDGAIYQAAIAGGYGFTAMGILCLWMHFNASGKKNLWMVLASLCFGLAAGSRITYIFDAVFLLPVFLRSLWGKEKRSRPTLILKIICIYGPFAMCVAGLAMYNYDRFGSLFDVGMRYQNYNGHFHALSSPQFQFFRLNLHYILFHAYLYLLAPPWQNILPFGDTQKLSSLWLNNPFAWLFLFWIADWRNFKNWKPEIVWITCGIILLALLQLAVLASYCSIYDRYVTDFAPWMICVACIYYLYILQQYRESRLYWLLLTLGSLSVACGIIPTFTPQSFIP